MGAQRVMRTGAGQAATAGCGGRFPQATGSCLGLQVRGIGVAVTGDLRGPPEPRAVSQTADQRRVWGAWAERYGLDPGEVYQVALRTRPMETFAHVVPNHDPRECLAALHELEDEDVRSGLYTAFDGASELLNALPPEAWALVTSNDEHRVRGRFARTGLPVPR